MAIQLTTRASSELLKKSKQIFFYCKTGGCNGFEYVLEPVKSEPPKTETQTFDSGLLLYTCNLSMFHLLGTKIDWKEDMMGSRFVFDNPNANSMCGCGATFST
jgi:iron-sulfur cluster assembly accessory protein